MTLLFYSRFWQIFGKCKPDINYYKTNPYVPVLFFNFHETEQDTAILITILSEFKNMMTFCYNSRILLTIRNICPGHRKIVLSTMIYVDFCYQTNNSDKSNLDI